MKSLLGAFMAPFLLHSVGYNAGLETDPTLMLLTLVAG
jgi:hypothetical protein